MIPKIASWIKNHKRLALELFLGVLTAFSMWYGITVHNNNKKLSDSLEMANNNIEAYQDILNNSQQACGVLQMDMSKLKNSNDKLIQQLDSVREKSKIKNTTLITAATQKQTILVSNGKGVRGNLITILKDSIYNDSIKYNDLTKVIYTIGKDTVNIQLNMSNTQYLYTYKTREYKNKKNFFKRLFTFDFKKVDRYKYSIVNTNDLLKESEIRIITQE